MTEQQKGPDVTMQDILVRAIVVVCLIVQPITAYFVNSAADKLEKVYEMSVTSAVRIEAIDMRYMELDNRALKLRDRVDTLSERVSTLEGRK